MRYSELGRTGIKVSKIGLGTMTWGEQNSQEDGFEQMDHAIEHGVNFFDTAEMYPIDTRPETYGHTEEIVGSWLKKRKKRSEIILATKVCGPGRHHVRNGKCNFGRENILLLEGERISLPKLLLDVIYLQYTKQMNLIVKKSY